MAAPLRPAASSQPRQQAGDEVRLPRVATPAGRATSTAQPRKVRTPGRELQNGIRDPRYIWSRRLVAGARRAAEAASAAPNLPGCPHLHGRGRTAGRGCWAAGPPRAADRPASRGQLLQPRAAASMMCAQSFGARQLLLLRSRQADGMPSHEARHPLTAAAPRSEPRTNPAPKRVLTIAEKWQANWADPARRCPSRVAPSRHEADNPRTSRSRDRSWQTTCSTSTTPPHVGIGTSPRHSGSAASIRRPSATKNTSSHSFDQLARRWTQTTARAVTQTS
eukprot:COSAG01_NODE_3678_length_5803_cov_60.798738_2_plen_278_part_00